MVESNPISMLSPVERIRTSLQWNSRRLRRSVSDQMVYLAPHVEVSRLIGFKVGVCYLKTTLNASRAA